MQPKHYFLPALIISAVFLLPIIWLSGLKDNMILAFISADIVSTDTTSTTYTVPTTTLPTTTLPTNTTTYTVPTTTSTTTTVPTTTYPTTYTVPTTTNTTYTAPTTTSTTATVPTTTTYPTTYTVPMTTSTTYTAPTTTSTTTTLPTTDTTTTLPTTTLQTNTTTYTVPTTTAVPTTETTTTAPITTNTTTTYPTTTLPTTDTTVATTTTTKTNDLPKTDATNMLPTITTVPTNATTYTVPTTTSTTTTVPTTTTLPTTDTTNIIRATDAPQTLQIEFTNLISAPITQNQRICAKTNQAVEKVIYKITGIQTQYLTVIKASESEYCSYINIGNFTSGNYKLVAIAIQGSQTAHRELDIRINRPETATKPEANISTAPIINTKCQEIGITNEEECRKALLERYSPTMICQNLDQTACQNSMTTTSNLEKIILIQGQYEEIRIQESEIVNKSLSVEEVEQKINGEEEVRDIILPVREKTIQLTTLRATEEIKLENEQLIQTAPIVIIIDNDGDGLSNDMEKRLGTDPDKADTDGDGYNDKEEIANGYNPLGEGKAETKSSPIEKAIINNQEIEHPKSSGQQKESFVVEKIENSVSEKGYVLSGKCEPNSIATLYIYSDVPIVTTVATDEYGNWQYEFKESLEDGEHEVFVAINDDTGKVISKSNPLSFIVQEAKAVSATDITDIKKPLQTEEKKSDDMMIYYVTFAGIIIVLGILAFIFLILNKKKVKE